MKSKVTRRQVMAAAPVMAQAPAKPANETEAARTQTRQTAATLRKFKVSTLLEPSFQFKA